MNTKHQIIKPKVKKKKKRTNSTFLLTSLCFILFFFGPIYVSIFGVNIKSQRPQNRKNKQRT